MTMTIHKASQRALLLELWEEVARHRSLGETLPGLVQAMQSALRFRQLQLYEVVSDDSDLVLLAQWSHSSGVRSRHSPLGYGPSPVRALSAWASNAPSCASVGDGAWPHPLSLIEAALPKEAAMAGPLLAEHRLIGLLVISDVEDHGSPSEQQSRFEFLLKPAAVALQNELRLRELQVRGTAADADRHMLLERLGRKSLSESIIGADAGLRAVMERVDQVAPTEATVLILGETGSGKEVIARAIHERSARCKGPFIRVNCGALPPDLIDSELFGHEKGSFTGASAARRGWFERADGGTLFLDEIGELTPAAQVRLLRVLQDGIVQRVGSEHDIAVSLRIIAATHRDLPGMIHEGRFREDLWYRLAVFPIILPPLHERTEDIPALTKHFVDRAANRLGLPRPPITAWDLKKLEDYPWPGNVRELGAVLERAVILGRGRSLDLQTALGASHDTPGRLMIDRRSVQARVSGDSTKIVSLDAAITAHLDKALQATGGRLDGPHGAARLLHINPSTLRAKLRKLGIDPKRVRKQEENLR